MPHSPLHNRITLAQFDEALPDRTDPSALQIDLASIGDLTRRFKENFMAHLSESFRLAEDLSHLQIGHSKSLADILIQGLCEDPQAHDWSSFLAVTPLVSYFRSSEQTPYGTIPQARITLVEVRSPIGFWVLPEIKARVTADLLSKNDSFEELQPMFLNSAAGFVIEETSGHKPRVNQLYSRAAFVEMLENTNQLIIKIKCIFFIQLS